MMKISLIALIGSVSLLSAPLVFADAASHAKAAEDLLVANPLHPRPAGGGRDDGP